MRRFDPVAACLPLSALALACNGLSGVSAFEIVEDPDMPLDAAVASNDASSTSDGGTSTDAGASDATVELDASADSDGSANDATPPCTAASSGPRYGTAASGTGWSNHNGVLAPGDNQVAHTNGLDDVITVTGFGFTIPTTARIDGIKVDFNRNAIGTVNDEAVTLPKGNGKSNGKWPEGDFSGPYILTTYGGATDTWGASWTASDINAATFSVKISVKGTGDGHADAVGVTVYYCQ